MQSQTPIYIFFVVSYPPFPLIKRIMFLIKSGAGNVANNVLNRVLNGENRCIGWRWWCDRPRKVHRREGEKKQGQRYEKKDKNVRRQKTLVERREREGKNKKNAETSTGREKENKLETE